MKHEPNFSERRIRRLIAFGVILFAAVMNLDRVGMALSWLLNLLSPILMGLIFALVLYVPMHGFERILSRIDRHDRMPRKLESALSLLFTAIAVPMVLFVLMRFIIPQFISAVTNMISIVESNRSTIVDFVSRIGMDPTLVNEKIAELGAWIKANIAQIAGTTVNTAINIFGSVTDVLLALILAIYVLADKAALARNVEIIFSKWGMPEISRETIARYFPCLKAVFYAGGSIKRFAYPYFEQGVRIFATGEANAEPAAEFTLASILLANKGVYRASRLYRNAEGYRLARREV